MRTAIVHRVGRFGTGAAGGRAFWALAAGLLGGCAPATLLHAPNAATGWRAAAHVTAPSHDAADPAGRCLPDLPAAFDRLARRGSLLRFHIGEENSLGTPLWAHVQGVARLPAREEPTWVVSRSGGDAVAALVLAGGNSPSGDDVLATIAAPPDADHAGGIQVLGELLLIPFANRDGRSYVRFYDLSAPRAPLFLGELLLEEAGTIRYPGHASNVAMARLADGRNLLLSGAHSTRAVEAFVTRRPSGEGQTEAVLEWEHVATLYREIEPGLQTIALLPQCDGTLFLIGARNSRIPPPAFGRDRLRVYRLSEDDRGMPRLEEERAVHLRCEMCNFAAGAGPFITSDGGLVVYGAPHSDRQGILTIEAFTERR